MFELTTAQDAPAASRTATAAPSLGLHDLQSLIALQAYESPTERRRRSVKRGFDLLDVLDGVKMDLLVGRVAPDRLERLVAMLGQKTTSGDPRIDELMEDIELRARVELAKLGRYPE
eukprot:gene20413-21032_t